MCDYSLMCVPNRLAREREELVAHRFTTGSMGLASDLDLSPPPYSISAVIEGVLFDGKADLRLA